MRLNCEFGFFFNFVVGENGSGKSVVLIVIIFCFGGKVSLMNCGGSLKSFIKEGEDKVILIVKIKNQGFDVYQYDIYGDFIIVECWFNKIGGSGFNLKIVIGFIYLKKKEEVD